MYSNRGGSSYPQQQGYGGQSSYGQNPTSAYPGSSSIGTDASSQLGMHSRHQSILAAAREPDISGYRSHQSVSGPYGGQYSSLYGAASLGSSQQVSALTAKGSQQTAVEARGAYGSLRPSSPRYASAEYVPSTSHGYTLKTDRLLADKIPDYTSIDRRQYNDRQSAYAGRDLPSDAAGRYSDSAGYAPHQPEIYDRIDQAVLREQILKNQSLQSASHESVVRQADYLAARASSLRHPPQEVDPYDPRAVSSAGRASYTSQQTSSILGAAPQRNMDNLLYSQGSTNPGYGVSLPPGRDYGLGKGLHGSALESDFPSTVPSRGGHLRADDRKDERTGYTRALDLRDQDRQRERLLERERERERDREREKEREHERERERQRERDRERERERERKRALELRDRERDQQRRRALEVRRERTPLRSSKDRQASVLLKDAAHRDSPRLGSLHRLHSPIKRRDYICKVYSSSLVDVERNFLSLDKRYTKLYISPDFSKLVVNWPREDLKLSFRTPVSFEHDFVEEGNSVDQKESFINQLDAQALSSEHRTVWNAKVILMSGLSRSAAEELSSDKIVDDRVPHICNLLRFAVLRKDRSFTAIGGPWDPIDGPDPSVDGSSLIQTVLRYARDVTQLDLKSCKLWNRFLEIHYDRVGKDGLFSHKEITVLFVPDLSDSLPSLDAWREQWLSHKKAVAERERLLSSKREKERLKEKKDGARGKESTTKDAKRVEKAGRIVESIKGEKDSSSAVGKESESGAEAGVKQPNMEDKAVLVGESSATKDEVNKNTPESVKTVKKKIVKRIVKQKVAKKSVEGNESKIVENVEAETEVAVDKSAKLEVSGERGASSSENAKAKKIIKKKVVKKLVDVDPVQTEVKSIESAVNNENAQDTLQEEKSEETQTKTFTRKKVAKRLLDGDPVQAEARSTDPAVISVNNENLQDAVQDKSEVKTDSGGVGVVRAGPVKKKIIKKIIKRVPKRKSANGAADNEVPENKEADKDGKAAVQKETEANSSGEAKPETSKASGIKQEGDAVNEKKASDITRNSDAEKQIVHPKDNIDEKERSKDNEKSVDQKDRKSADAKDEQKRKISKELERKKSEEPPRHPGLILQTKSCKDSKLHSLSLSLDSLLDYTDNDVEESTFELSLFAESMYEMLQYQMGSRILPFLEKLRIKFVRKRNQKKRQREEADEKKRIKESSSKRLKSNASPEETEKTKSVVKTEVDADEKSGDKVEKMEVDTKVVAENTKAPKQEKEDDGGEGNNEDEVIEEADEEEEEDPEEDPDEDPDEDPVEDPNEDEEMQEGSSRDDTSVENPDQKNIDTNAEEEKNSAIVEGEKNDSKVEEETKNPNTKVEKNETDAEKASGKEKDDQIKTGMSIKACKGKEDVNGKDATKERVPARKEAKAVDKELLEAFRFFDRNRVGYIRLEDMRVILHNLGKYLSHRDVKELAHSALLESSTGRDDRILYEKLVRMTGLGKD